MHYREYRSILSPQNGINLYRGCTHGCIYCDSRSDCYQMKHDFEDVEVKSHAPEQLEAELRRRRSKCMIGTGSMSDPYQPLEAELSVTRRCLEVVERQGFGVAIQTKSDLILRDLDLLKQINGQTKCVVQITLTTLDDALCKKLEPNVCPTGRRLEVLHCMREAGIPTVVWLCPLLPEINDTEENLTGLVRACARANVTGILNFGIGLTLRDGNRDYFYSALDRIFPGLSSLYRRKFGSRYQVLSDRNEELMQLFYRECARNGIPSDRDKIFEYLHAFPETGSQLSMF